MQASVVQSCKQVFYLNFVSDFSLLILRFFFCCASSMPLRSNRAFQQQNKKTETLQKLKRNEVKLITEVEVGHRPTGGLSNFSSELQKIQPIK